MNKGEHTTNRFERSWEEWDERIGDGAQPREMLADLSSEKIMQLLAGAGSERRYERDILATEVMNRLVRARHNVDDSMENVADLLGDVQSQGQRTREDVHKTEEVVARLQGSEALGTDSAQELTAHSASAIVETLIAGIERATSALERLEKVRKNDLERALGSDEEDDEAN